jgi:hypothetical protein
VTNRRLPAAGIWRLPGSILLFALLLPGLAVAQPAQPDSAARPVVPDSAPGAAKDSAPYRPAKSTGTAVLLSFLLPGGGQVYTGNWWKAALIAPAEVTLGYFVLREHAATSEALSAGDSTGYVRHRDARTAFLWWTGAVVAFSMADAYVSAQMYGFDREIRFAIGPMRAGVSIGL